MGVNDGNWKKHCCIKHDKSRNIKSVYIYVYLTSVYIPPCKIITNTGGVAHDHHHEKDDDDNKKPPFHWIWNPSLFIYVSYV